MRKEGTSASKCTRIRQLGSATCTGASCWPSDWGLYVLPGVVGVQMVIWPQALAGCMLHGISGGLGVLPWVPVLFLRKRLLPLCWLRVLHWIGEGWNGAAGFPVSCLPRPAPSLYSVHCSDILPHVQLLRFHACWWLLSHGLCWFRHFGVHVHNQAVGQFNVSGRERWGQHSAPAQKHTKYLCEDVAGAFVLTSRLAVLPSAG